MTPDDLIADGWKEFKDHGKRPECRSFQLRIRDQIGTRYFVQAVLYPPIAGHPPAWEAWLNFGRGFTWSEAVMNVLLYCLPKEATTANIREWADELWQRLEPRYYERIDE